MSSSPRQSLAVTPSPAPFQSFPYAAVGDAANAGPFETLHCASEDAGVGPDPAAERAAAENRARAEGQEAGRAEARKIFEEHIGKERAAIARALAQFTRDRAAYLQKVEAEVVQPSLSIARKILHREAQVDPLLLAGIVRVALENIDGATGVVLRLHPQNAADWRTYLTTRLDPTDLPQIVEDPAQPLDRCALETSMGSALVGLEVQLKEIEQGLMDLLAARPGAAP